MVGGEFNCVRDTDGFCCRYVALIVAIMMVGRSNVEPLRTVGSPGWGGEPAGARGVSLQLKFPLICV